MFVRRHAHFWLFGSTSRCSASSTSLITQREASEPCSTRPSALQISTAAALFFEVLIELTLQVTIGEPTGEPVLVPPRSAALVERFERHYSPSLAVA